VQKGLDTWTKISRVAQTGNEWRVKRENTKKRESFVRSKFGRAARPSIRNSLFMSKSSRSRICNLRRPSFFPVFGAIVDITVINLHSLRHPSNGASTMIKPKADK